MKKCGIIASLGLAALLCVSCLQYSSYAADSKEQTIEVKVNGAYTISWDCLSDISGESAIVMNQNEAKTNWSCVVTGNSNSDSGWTLSAVTNTTPTSNALQGAESDDSIPALSTSVDSSLTAGTAGWGYQVTSSDASAAVAGKWRGVSDNVSSQSTMIAPSQTQQRGELSFKIWYGFATSETQAADTYSTSVKYTFAPVSSD